MNNQKLHGLLILLFILPLDLLAQSNLCATRPDQTKKILEHLENRLLCESLSPGDCIKLVAGGSVAGVGGLIAAKKLLKLGQMDLKSDLDIICSSTFDNFSFKNYRRPKFDLLLLTTFVSTAEAGEQFFCRLHPGATYRSEVANLTRAMSQEIDHDISTLVSVSDTNSTLSSDTESLKKYLIAETDDYLARLKQMTSEEARRIFPSVERQIRGASVKGDYRAVRAHMKNSVSYLENQGVDMGTVSPDLDKFRKNSEFLSQRAMNPTKPCNITNEIQMVLLKNSMNESFIRAEFEKIKIKCPSLKVDELTEKALTISRKKVALSLAVREKLMLELDLKKLSQIPSRQASEISEKTKELSRQSVEKLNRIPLGQFQSPDIGISAGKLEKFGKGIGVMATNLHSFAKTARALSPVTLFAGGKAALASTGVGAIPVVAESVIEEAVLQSVTFKPEECITQELRSPKNQNASSEAKLGYYFLNYKPSNCESSLEMGLQLGKFLQLNSQDRLNILSYNDKLCSAVHRLYNNENSFASFEASCIDDKGGYKLRDIESEKGNYKLIQQRSREARDAGLSGTDYEKYVRGNLTSRDQTVTRDQNSLLINYSATVSKLSKCSKFDIKLNSDSQKFTNSCAPLIFPVLNSVYDYAMLSAQCSGLSQAYSEVYGKNFIKNSNQSISNIRDEEQR